MKIIKYEHSCIALEEQGELLIVDPGKFSKSFKTSDNILCVVVTHVHSDHYDPEILKEIRSLNPDAKFYSVEQVALQSPDIGFEIINTGQSYANGPFHFEFYGGQHELYAGFSNVGVMINNALYYPGDSYSKPDRPIKLLGAPASAPWLRVTEASQFIKDCGAEKVFPMHNALLSEEGKSVHYRILAEAAHEAGSDWLPLENGDSIEI